MMTCHRMRGRAPVIRDGRREERREEMGRDGIILFLEVFFLFLFYIVLFLGWMALALWGTFSRSFFDTRADLGFFWA